MLKFNIETIVDSNKTNDFSKVYDDRFKNYFEILSKRLDELGNIVAEGIKENITSRNYPGGSIDVQRGGTPLYDTGELYNSIAKSRINDTEVDVYINGDRSKIGLWQHKGEYKGGVAREFWTITQPIQDKINEMLEQIFSNSKL